MIGAFLQDTPKRLAELQSAWTEGDLQTLRKVAHTLKSSSANVGATHLAKLCQEVEEQARNGHSDSILDRERRISEEVPRVLAALGEQRQRNPASPQTEGVNPCS